MSILSSLSKHLPFFGHPASTRSVSASPAPEATASPSPRLREESYTLEEQLALAAAFARRFDAQVGADGTKALESPQSTRSPTVTSSLWHSSVDKRGPDVHQAQSAPAIMTVTPQRSR